MWILPVVGYAGIVLGFGFLTLAIASGLYYLSELVEEHTVLTRRLLTRLIYTVGAAQLLLALVDGFPWWLSLLSVGSHVVYMGNLRHFPIVKLTDPVFIASCLLVLLNHFLWFHHFSQPPTRPPSSSFYDPLPVAPTFTEISSFFGIFVWLVPFALFVSLSASENVLPSMGSEYATGGQVRTGEYGGSGAGGGGGLSDGRGGKRGRKGLIKAGVDWLRDWVEETGRVIGVGGKERGF